MIILLDGPKGAGKSSVSNILINKLGNSIYLSLDNERKILVNQDKSKTELNKEAFENIMRKALDYLREGNHLIIDCGLNEERIARLEELALLTHKKLYKFFLKASYDILLDRVKHRDSSKGHDTDIKRFDETYKIVTSKEFKDFHIIETENLSIGEVATYIQKTLSE
jgi:cytidylate kinase